MKKTKKTITAEQFDELSCSNSTWTYDDFLKKLEEYTGIEARSYTAYQFFDAAGDFIGNSDEIALEELLEKAGIEVTDDGM